MTTPQDSSDEKPKTFEQVKLPWIIHKLLSFTILDKAMKPIGWCLDKILGNKL